MKCIEKVCKTELTLVSITVTKHKFIRPDCVMPGEMLASGCLNVMGIKYSRFLSFYPSSYDSRIHLVDSMPHP